MAWSCGHCQILPIWVFKLVRNNKSKVYRKLSIKYHPDKNPDEESKRTAEVCGSSSHRAWFFCPLPGLFAQGNSVKLGMPTRTEWFRRFCGTSDVNFQMFTYNKYSKNIFLISCGYIPIIPSRSDHSEGLLWGAKKVNPSLVCRSWTIRTRRSSMTLVEWRCIAACLLH